MNFSTLDSMPLAEKLHRKHIGHLQLLTLPEPTPEPPAVAGNACSPKSDHDSDLILIDLVNHKDELEDWVEQGAMLALRVLAPYSPLKDAERKSVNMVAAGACAPFAAIVGRDLQFGKVLELGDADSSEIEACKGTFHRALFGCNGGIPSKENLLTLLSLLRHDGQIALFGLPVNKITSVQLALSHSGFSTRAAGVEGELGFISGSIENMAHFRAKGRLD